MTADGSGSSVRGLAEALLLFPLGYLIAAVVGRRRATWTLAVVVVGALAGLRFQDQVPPALVLMLVAAALVGWSATRGQLWPPTVVTLQTAGVVLFAAVAFSAMAVDQELGRYLLAAGWIGHAVWDFAHHRLNLVVSRSFAEWCGVFDLLGGIAILFLPLP